MGMMGRGGVSILLTLLLAGQCWGRMLVEVEFDINSREYQDKQTVPDILAGFLKDPNLIWLRYLNTMVDGTPYKTPSRVAFFEFEGPKEWAAFETRQKSPTHILFDLFWTPWRRNLWVSTSNEPPTTPRERKAGEEGYLYCLKYTVDPAKKAAFEGLKRKKLPASLAVMEGMGSLLNRTAYQDTAMQSTFQNLVIYEFTSLKGLSNAVYGMKIMETSKDSRELFLDYAATILQPPYEKGGNILNAADFRRREEEARIAEEARKAEEERKAEEARKADGDTTPIN